MANYSIEDQVIALSAVFMSARLVNDLAKQGRIDEDSLECLMGSLLKTDADSVEGVYMPVPAGSFTFSSDEEGAVDSQDGSAEDQVEGRRDDRPSVNWGKPSGKPGLQALQPGFDELKAALGKRQEKRKVDVMRYALTLLFLENRLRKRNDLMGLMSRRIDQIKLQTQHFSLTHSTIIGAFASLYTDTVSTFPQRIQVTGDPKYLKVDENADKIRAILLTGIRAAILWRQTGGRRWRLLFNKSSHLAAIEQIEKRMAADANR